MKARAGEFVADPDDPYGNDTLGRREQVEEFCERVRATATPVVWAVEGAWGSGRTAFSRMCAAVLRNDPGVAAVVAVDARTQGVTGMPLVDLAVAVGRELESASREQTGESERRRRRSRLAELAGAVAEPRLLLREFGRGDLPLTDTVEKMSRLVREYMDSLNGLVVVWIDELDRCPPEYALGMLGAVRSICDHAGVATVVSVRPDTLEAAVARIHGDHAGAGCWSRLPRPRTPSCRRTPESTSTRRSRCSPAAASAGSGAEVRSHRRRRSAQSDRSRAPRGGRPWGVSPAIGPGRETCRQTL